MRGSQVENQFAMLFGVYSQVIFFLLFIIQYKSHNLSNHLINYTVDFLPFLIIAKARNLKLIKTKRIAYTL